MYMTDKNIGGKQWVGLDFNVASDYTYGSPQAIRSRLRQLIGAPILLPGEQSEVQK